MDGSKDKKKNLEEETGVQFLGYLVLDMVHSSTVINVKCYQGG